MAGSQGSADENPPSVCEEQPSRVSVRPGSPYPRLYNQSTHSSAGLDIDAPPPCPLEFLTRPNSSKAHQAPSSCQTSDRRSGSTQRATSIRWAENLPVPDRKPLSSPAQNSVTSNSESQTLPITHNDSQIYGELFQRTPDYEAQKTHQPQQLQINEVQREDEPRTSEKMAYSGLQDLSTAPRRPIAPITQAMYDLESDTQYDAASATTSSDEHIASYLASRALLTFQTLNGTPERQDVEDKSKKSHSSWDVSEDDNDSSADGDGSSRFITKPIEAGDTLSFTPSAMINSWLGTIPRSPPVEFSQDGIQNHWKHGIDPLDGDFMDEVEQPATLINGENDKIRSSWKYRRQVWSSTFLIHREMSARESIKRRQREMEEQARDQSSIAGQLKQHAAAQPRAQTSSVAAWLKSSEPVAIEKSANLEYHQESTANMKQTFANCILRPVLKSDARDCADMYHMATPENSLVHDTDKISSRRFETIMDECTREKLPFVVATTEKIDLTDSTNWPSGGGYQQYMEFVKWKQAQPASEGYSDSKICGIAFLTPYERGLGFGCGAASQTVQMTIVVHPEYRRQGVGSALLHRLLTQTSVLFQGDVNYEWKDPAVAKDAFYIPEFREIHRIVIQGMVDGEDSEDLQWKENFLKMFQFHRVGQLNQVYQVVKPHTVKWYDQVIWEHWAKNSRADTGQNFNDIDESECSYDYPGKSHTHMLHRASSLHDGQKAPEAYRL